MKLDFSHLNLEFLIQARDLAREDAELTATLLDMPVEVMHSLATVTPSSLANLTELKAPLVLPRHEAWWWRRFLEAVHEGNPDEIRAVIDHASLLIAASGRRPTNRNRQAQH